MDNWYSKLELNSMLKNQKLFVPSSVNNINHSTGSLMRHWRGSLVGLCCVFISKLQNESALMT